MDFKLFMKDNHKERGSEMYAATKSLCDENGEPLLWTLKPISTKENDDIREECMYEEQIPGKIGQYRSKMNGTKYITKLICRTVVEPNLYDKTLQDSYGVMSPEELIKEMIDDPGEYDELSVKVSSLNGYDTLQDKVEEAKN